MSMLKPRGKKQKGRTVAEGGWKGLGWIQLVFTMGTTALEWKKSALWSHVPGGQGRRDFCPSSTSSKKDRRLAKKDKTQEAPSSLGQRSTWGTRKKGGKNLLKQSSQPERGESRHQCPGSPFLKKPLNAGADVDVTVAGDRSKLREAWITGRSGSVLCPKLSKEERQKQTEE